MRIPPQHRPALLSALLAIALYAITLPGTYIYDDVYIAELDPRLTKVSRWSEYLTKGYFMGAPDRLWRPLTSLSFAVGRQLHGDRPWVPHLINILLYASVSFTVTTLARRLTIPQAASSGGTDIPVCYGAVSDTGTPVSEPSHSSHLAAPLAGRVPVPAPSPSRATWLTALLFPLHPVHVEPVAYLVGRADLLSTLLILLGILLFLKRPLTTRRSLAIWLCTLSAILTKEPGLLLPAYLLALLPWRRISQLGTRNSELGTPPSPIPQSAIRNPQLPPTQETEKNANQLLLLLLLFTLSTYIIFREQSRIFKFSWDPAFLDQTIQPLVIASSRDRWLLPFSLLGRYTQLLLFPWRLSIDYSGWTSHIHSWSDPYFYLGLLTVLAWWTAAILSYLRKNFLVLSLLLCLALSYSMISNFGIVIGTNFGERLIFLPSVFFILLLSLAAARLPNRILIPALVILVPLAVVRVETYAWRWLDAFRLYSLCAQDQPTSARLKMLVMDRYREVGDFASAQRVGLEGCAAEPDYWRIWYYTAEMAAEQGRLDEARALIARGLQCPRTDPGSFGFLRGQIDQQKFPTDPTTLPSTKPKASPTP